MSSRSSAAPSGLRRRRAPRTSTVSMNDSMSAGSRWPSTYGNAMQVAVSSSARNGSPDATPSHRLVSTCWTNASASAWLMSPSWPAVALAWPALAWPALTWLVLGWPAGRRRALFFLLTASSYDPQPTKLGVKGVDQMPEGDVHRFRQTEPARGLQGGDAMAGGPPHAHRVDQRGTLQAVARQGGGDHVHRLGRHPDVLLVAGRGRQHAGRVTPRVVQRVGPVGGGDRPQGIGAGHAGRGPRPGGGQLAHGQQRDPAPDLIQPADVLVQAGQRDPAALRDRRQGEPVQARLVGDGRGFGDDPLRGQPGARHVSV